jgi:hypothetical protein
MAFPDPSYDPARAIVEAKKETLERILGLNPPARSVGPTINEIRRDALEKVLSDNGQL